MNIVHIDTGREMRGGQYQLLLLLGCLEQAGHQVTLLARQGSPLQDHARKSGFKVFAATLFNMFRFSGETDMVHAHDARGHAIAALMSRSPFVVSRRVAFPIKRSIVSRWKYARAARYLAVSKFVSDQLRNAGISDTRISIVYDGVGEVAQGCWDPNAPAVALASRDAKKGRIFIDEASRIAGIPIVFSESLATDLQRASSFVYITQSEGLGSGALLAMAMGIPVIASRVEGLAEVFENEISGLYTGSDPAQIAQAMRRLIESPELALAIVQQARERVATQFSASKLLERTLQAYARSLHE